MCLFKKRDLSQPYIWRVINESPIVLSIVKVWQRWRFQIPFWNMRPRVPTPFNPMVGISIIANASLPWIAVFSFEVVELSSSGGRLGIGVVADY